MNWINNVQAGTEGDIEWVVRWLIDEAVWLVNGHNAVTGESYEEKVELIPSHIFGPDSQDIENINYALDRVIVHLGGQSKAPKKGEI